MIRARMRSKVVFPAPFLPIKMIVSPDFTLKVTSLKTGRRLKDFDSRETESIKIKRILSGQ